ncbi:MFS transporter [uncultured Agrococcus sp.]|uniref:MFS transporter n=1 Tax=uncultured Agrococcus sp. TaxID=382258 RepID=UPI0025F7EADC|nr:MFS transporter [uncultured Agrococcus sp.]
MTSTRPLFAARLGTSLAFGVVGFLFAVWLVHIPAVQSATGVSKGELGTALLALGLGSIVGMQVGGSVIARFGARWPLLVGHLIMVVTLLGPALAGGLWTLMVALLLFGIGNGLADVAMNAEAVEVERDKGKAIMSSMHAFFSVGTAVGAAYGWLVQTLALPTLISFVIASGLGLVAAGIAAALIPSRSAEPEPTTAEMMIAARVPDATVGERPKRAVPISQILLLALLGFVFMLAEGVASDWSALHAVEELGTSEATGAIAYGAFAVSMTAARFVIDLVVRRFGAVAVVRYGSIIAAIGLGVVVLSPGFWLALVGWMVFALGIAGVVPQIFTAAGNLPVRKRAVLLARIVGAGYIGLLSGPAIIGWVAGVTGLNGALLVPLLLCVLGVVGASSVRPSDRPTAA